MRRWDRDDDEPRFGYGRYGRPLLERGHRDEETIREVLRAAGFEEYHEDLQGFSVGGGGEAPHSVVSLAMDDDLQVTRLRGYSEALEKAGYQLQKDPTDPLILEVWPVGKVRP